MNYYHAPIKFVRDKQIAVYVFMSLSFMDKGGGMKPQGPKEPEHAFSTARDQSINACVPSVWRHPVGETIPRERPLTIAATKASSNPVLEGNASSPPQREIDRL